MKFGNQSNELKKPKSPIRTFLLAVLVFQLGFSAPGVFPLLHSAQASDTDDAQLEVCNPINDSQKVSNDPNVKVPGYTDCLVAEQARKAKRQATVKSVIFGVLGGVCVTLAIGEWAGSGGVCAVISTAASALGKLYDTTLKTKIEDESNATSKG